MELWYLHYFGENVKCGLVSKHVKTCFKESKNTKKFCLIISYNIYIYKKHISKTLT